MLRQWQFKLMWHDGHTSQIIIEAYYTSQAWVKLMGQPDQLRVDNLVSATLERIIYL